jgi:hypothetical protein
VWATNIISARTGKNHKSLLCLIDKFLMQPILQFRDHFRRLAANRLAIYLIRSKTQRTCRGD